MVRVRSVLAWFPCLCLVMDLRLLPVFRLRAVAVDPRPRVAVVSPPGRLAFPRENRRPRGSPSNRTYPRPDFRLFLCQLHGDSLNRFLAHSLPLYWSYVCCCLSGFLDYSFLLSSKRSSASSFRSCMCTCLYHFPWQSRRSTITGDNIFFTCRGPI